jgi:predicted MFS family arabinose efflux permease
MAISGAFLHTLLTALTTYGGLIVYTYVGVTFDRVTKSNGNVLAKLLFIWGIAATVGNIIAGRLIGKVGSRRIINSAILGAVQLAASNCYWLCVRGLV